VRSPLYLARAPLILGEKRIFAHFSVIYNWKIVQFASRIGAPSCLTGLSPHALLIACAFCPQ